MEKKLLITSLQSNAGKSIIVRLNHRPDNKIVELYPVVLGENEDGEDEKWTDTMDSFEAILEEKGVDDEEDRKVIRRSINYNSKKIAEHQAEQVLARMTAGGKAKRARLDKINNSPPKEVSVSKTLMMHEGKVKVKGMFVGGSTRVENMYIIIGFRCGSCDEPNIIYDFSSRPRLPSEVYHILAPKNLNKLLERECVGCRNKEGHEPFKKLISALRVELRDDIASNDPPTTDVILFNTVPNDVIWYEPIKITGSIDEIKVKDKSLTHIFAGLPSTSNDIAVERIEKVESDIITPEDEKKIHEFLTKNKGRVIEKLAELYMPSHVGDMDTKEGILMCAASTGLGPKYRINILLIGETGLAKTTLAKGAIRLVPGSKFTSAMDATTNSLICVVDPDTGHFRFGPLITTNGAICVVDVEKRTDGVNPNTEGNPPTDPGKDTSGSNESENSNADSKTNVTNVTNVTKEQQLGIACQIFDSLVSGDHQLGVEKEVLESWFIEALTVSGFDKDNVDKLINDMVRDGFLEKVVTENDGVIYDMLRKVMSGGATR